MASSISRYRKLPDVVTVDVKGRWLRSKSLRLTPQVSGRFVHTLEQGDRLDHLAYKHYGQPRHWWRICDANPEILSPWELVGKEPRSTVRFEIVRTGPDPPWSALLVKLRESLGVETALLGTNERPFADLETASETGEQTWRWTLNVVFNRLSTSLETLTAIVVNRETGFTLTEAPEEIGRIGKPLAIPPRAS